MSDRHTGDHSANMIILRMSYQKVAVVVLLVKPVTIIIVVISITTTRLS